MSTQFNLVWRLFGASVLGYFAVTGVCYSASATLRPEDATPSRAGTNNPRPVTIDETNRYTTGFTPVTPVETVTIANLSEEMVAHLGSQEKVAMLALSQGCVVASGQAFELAERTAAILRSKGYGVRTISQPQVAMATGRATKASGALTGAASSELLSTLGLTALVLVSLEGAEANRLSVEYSVRAPLKGVLQEIHKGRIALAAASPHQAQSSSGNLLTNGGFEADWTTGWKRKFGDIEKGANTTEVIEGADGRVLHMKHTGLSHVQVYQIVDIPEGDIWFHFQAKFRTWEGPISGFSGTGTGGITLMLIGTDGKLLGELWAGNYVKNLFAGSGLIGVPEGPKDSNRGNFYTLPNDKTTEDWINVSKIIQDRMGGVSRAEIKKISVLISVGATHPRAGAEAWVDNLILEVRK